MLKTLLAQAYAEARRSPDPSSQNGALLVHQDYSGRMEILCEGYNHFYKGIPPELNDRDKKLQRITHAERDCLYSAADLGIRVRGKTLICPWQACRACMQAIIGCGVSSIVYHRERFIQTDPRWLGEIAESLQWAQAAGIKLTAVEGPIDADPILISGNLWSPRSLDYA